MWKIRNYISFDDLRLKEDDTSVNPPTEYEITLMARSINLNKVLGQLQFYANYIPPSVIQTHEIPVINKTIFEIDDEYNLFRLVYNRYHNHFFTIIDDELADTFSNNTEQVKRKIALWFNKYINKIFYTAPKYIALLDLYTQEKNNLMKGMQEAISEEGSNTTEASAESSASNSSTTKNLETPLTGAEISNGYQNSQNNQIASGSTESSSSVEGTHNKEIIRSYDNVNLISKLDEIDRKYNMVLNEWLDEFNRLFIINKEA